MLFLDEEQEAIKLSFLDEILAIWQEYGI